MFHCVRYRLLVQSVATQQNCCCSRFDNVRDSARYKFWLFLSAKLFRVWYRINNNGYSASFNCLLVFSDLRHFQRINYNTYPYTTAEHDK